MKNILFIIFYCLSFLSIPYADAGNQQKNPEQKKKRYSSMEAESLLTNPNINWKMSKTKHFYYFYEKKAHWVTFYRKAEISYEKIKKDLLIKKDPKGKCFVYLVPSFEHWSKFLGQVGIGTNATGFYRGKEIFMCSDDKLQRKESEKTFCHEVCHLIFMKFWGKRICPLWINEGMAEYESSFLHKFTPKYRLPQNIIQTDRWFSIKKLTNVRAYPSDNMTNYLFYRQSEWLVKYLIERHPRPMFRKFMSELQKKPYDFETAFLKTYGKQYKSIEVFDKKYRVFAKRLIK